jgi:hypothetical protein
MLHWRAANATTRPNGLAYVANRRTYISIDPHRQATRLPYNGCHAPRAIPIVGQALPLAGLAEGRARLVPFVGAVAKEIRFVAASLFATTQNHVPSGVAGLTKRLQVYSYRAQSAGDAPALQRLPRTAYNFQIVGQALPLAGSSGGRSSLRPICLPTSRYSQQPKAIAIPAWLA